MTILDPGIVVPITPSRPPPDGSSVNVPRSLSDVHGAVDVSIETGLDSNVFAATRWDFKSVTLGRDGQDTKAVLTIGLNAEDLTAGGEIGDEHFSQLLEQLNPDHRVRISQRLGASNALVYFQGFPQVPTISWGASTQLVTCVCLSEGQELMRHSAVAQILGRLMRFDPLADWDISNTDETLVSALGVVFNAGNRPNRSASAYPFEGKFGGTHELHLFTEDDAPEAEFWSYAEALRYIVYFHGMDPPKGVDMARFLANTKDMVGQDPAPMAGDPFVKRMTQRVENLSATSTSAEQAIALLVDAAGLHYQIALRERSGPQVSRDLDFVLRVYATIETQEDVNDDPFQQQGGPQVLDIPREAPFTSMSGRTPFSIALANRAQESNLTVDRRAINAPIILGGFKEFEVTVLMRPGWLPHAQLDNLSDQASKTAAEAFWDDEFAPPPDPVTRVPNSIYNGAHPDHAPVAAVGRLWIFPDDHRYIDGDLTTSEFARDNWPAELYSPYNPDGVDQLVLTRGAIGGQISDAADWVPRRRPFRDLIARLRGTDERSPIVRFHFDHSDPFTALAADGWVRFTGQVYVDEQRMAITIMEDDLWSAATLVPDLESEADTNNMLCAYINGHFMLSVTAVIRGDRRMTLRPKPQSSFSRVRQQISDAGTETFRNDNRRGQNSHLNAQATDADPRFEDRLDDEKFERYGEREAEIGSGDRVAGSFSVPFIDTTYRLGDSFSGVAGMGLTFARFPEVVGIEYTHDPQAGYKTVVHLTDLREAPEVGLE